MRNRPLRHAVIARVFMKHTWPNGSGHERANAVVSKRGAVAFPIGSPPLSPGFGIVLRLCNRRERAVKRPNCPIECARGGNPELLPDGERRKVLVASDGDVIGEDLKDAVVFGSGLLLQLRFADVVAGFGDGLTVFRVLW